MPAYVTYNGMPAERLKTLLLLELFMQSITKRNIPIIWFSNWWYLLYIIHNLIYKDIFIFYTIKTLFIIG